MRNIFFVTAILLGCLSSGSLYARGANVPFGYSHYPLLVFELVQHRLFTPLASSGNCAETPELYDSLNGYICRVSQALQMTKAGVKSAVVGGKYYVGRLTQNTEGYQTLLEVWEDSSSGHGSSAKKTLMYFRNADGKQGRIFWRFNDPLADGYPVGILVEWDSTPSDRHWFRVIEQVQKPTGSPTAWLNRDHAVRIEGETYPAQSLMKASVTVSFGASGSSPASSIVATAVRNASYTVAMGEVREGEDFSTAVVTPLPIECADNRNQGQLTLPLYALAKSGLNLVDVLVDARCGLISSIVDFRPTGRPASEEFLGLLSGNMGYTLDPTEPVPFVP